MHVCLQRFIGFSRHGEYILEMLSIALSIPKVELFNSEVAFSKNLLEISVMFHLNITFSQMFFLEEK